MARLSIRHAGVLVAAAGVGGPNGDGSQYKLNIQPVIPITLNRTWNLISRTILPVITQRNVVDSGEQSGIGDIVQSFFLSPQAPTASGWIWGAGPVVPQW